MPTYGIIQKKLNLGLLRTYTWMFVVAKVTEPIIGADILKYYHLLPDLTKSLLLVGKTLCSTEGVIMESSQPSINLLTENSNSNKKNNINKKRFL